MRHRTFAILFLIVIHILIVVFTTLADSRNVELIYQTIGSYLGWAYPPEEWLKPFYSDANITVTSDIVDVCVDLMKMYEPFLFFHKEDAYIELFYPMDLKAYLNKCSLWEDQLLKDQKHLDEGKVSLDFLAAFGRTRDDSDKFYLK